MAGMERRVAERTFYDGNYYCMLHVDRYNLVERKIMDNC